MLTAVQIARLAVAYGFEVTDIEEEMVTLGFHSSAEVWMMPDDGEKVFAVIAQSSWGYESGYEWAEYEVGTLPVREMFSYLAWCKKISEEQIARMEAMFAEDVDMYLVGPQWIQENE